MFSDLDSLLRRFSQLGAVRAFCKPLAENDNSKQQIYLGGNLDVVQMFPFEAVEATPNGKNSTYKAKLDFVWVGDGVTEQATGAQLILYPQYPEVRLSGFLRGCNMHRVNKCDPSQKSSVDLTTGMMGEFYFLELPVMAKRSLICHLLVVLFHKNLGRCNRNPHSRKKVYFLICHCLGAIQNLLFWKGLEKFEMSAGTRQCV
jgi:hypothetical protein